MSPTAAEPPPDSRLRLPSVAILNRAHLPVRLARHLRCLLAELRAGRQDATARKQIRLLLREPLLLYCLEVAGSWCRDDGKAALAATDSHDSAQDGLLADLRPELLAVVMSAREQATGRCSGGDSLDAIKNALLGFVPVTCRTAGVARNKISYHRYEEGSHRSPEQAVWPRYEPLRALGQGHFGEVKLAKECCSGCNVAVKVFERQPHESEEADEACDEGQILNALGHPNLIRIFEVVESEDAVFVVMEFATGSTLSKYLSHTPRGDWIAGAVQQVVSATAYCHGQHILHGDLKPENVLLGGFRPDGCPLCLVSDFGHAQLCLAQRVSVSVVGDPRYVAPEVVQGTGMSAKSDVFMLGMTTFELLSGGWLPFFQEKADNLDSDCPFYDSTRGWFMLNKGPVHERVQNGLNFEDKQLLSARQLNHEPESFGASQNALLLLTQMLAWAEEERPDAVDVLNAAWIVSGSKACKVARAATAPAEYGLWAPTSATFQERLAERARSSLMYRRLLGAVSYSLETCDIFKARLLFRWVDVDGTGLLEMKHFKQAARLVGLDEKVAEDIFDATDVFGQGFVDFKNFAAVMMDIEAFEDSKLERLLRTALNRLRGPDDGSPGADVVSPTVSFETLKDLFFFPAWRVNTNLSMQPLIEELHQHLIGCGVEDSISAAELLHIVRGKPLALHPSGEDKVSGPN